MNKTQNLPKYGEENIRRISCKRLWKATTSFLEQPNVAYTIIALLALADYLSLYDLFDRVSFFGWLVKLFMGGTAALLLEVLPTIGATQLHRVFQKESPAFTAFLPLMCFGALVIVLSYLRFSSKELLISIDTGMRSMTGTDVLTDSDSSNAVPIILFQCIFNVLTSAASFLLGWNSSDPHKAELKERQQLIIDLDEQILLTQTAVKMLNSMDFKVMAFEEKAYTENLKRQLEALRDELYVKSVMILGKNSKSEEEVAELTDMLTKATPAPAPVPATPAPVSTANPAPAAIPADKRPNTTTV